MTALPRVRGSLVAAASLAARGGSGAGIRPALHPTSRRCSSLKYSPVFSVVAPGDLGASPVSVLRRHFHHGLLAVAATLLAASATAAAPAVASAAAAAAAQTGGAPSDVAIKAAFLFNFAKFAEWPALPARATIVACVVGDGQIADALAGIVRGKDIGGHGLRVVRPRDDDEWGGCQLLFIAGAEMARSAPALAGIRMRPVLSVSDGAGFSRAGGIIELYIDGGRMRFAINVDSVTRAGLRLSSRLLGLATVVRDRDAP